MNHKHKRVATPFRRGVLPVVMLSIVMGSCSSGTDVYFAFVSPDEMTVTLGVAACNAELEVEVDERVDEVVVKVNATNEAGQVDYDCADSVAFHLSEPLGRRQLIDASDGERIEVLDGG